LWIWIAVDRYEKRFVNCVLGNRDTATGKQLRGCPPGQRNPMGENGFLTKFDKINNLYAFEKKNRSI
jgi:hypothetical protein